MKAFSMFSGIGGFELGIQMASEDIELIGYSEIDKYAIQVYEKHFPGATNYGNATTIDGEQLPDFDLLVGGFPCQAFSVAGKREGFNETRGTLFFDIARILSDKRPRYLVLENVKGLLSHDKGKTFQTILRVLSDLGYGVEWQVLNSKDYSVPQNRERVFIVGHLGNRSPRKVFPITENVRETSDAKVNQKNLVDIINKKGKSKNKNIASTITGGAHSGGNHSDMDLLVTPVLTPEREKKRQNGRRFKEPDDPSFTLTGQDIHGVMLNEITKAKSQANRIYDSDGLATTLRSEGGGLGAKTGLYKVGSVNNSQSGTVYDPDGIAVTITGTGGGMGAKTGLYAVVKDGTKKGEATVETGDTVNLSYPNSKTRRGRVGKKIAQTLETSMEQYTFSGLRIRRLTPTECERLQGFPDGWTEGLSDTQRYKTLGNAVTTTVVKAVMERLLGGIVDTKIYTDGSCLGNPGVGGWGAVIIYPDGREKKLSGGEEATTNNRMEIQAIIKALSELLPGTSVEVLSDSEYVVNTMTKGWKKKLNTDLWYELNNVISRLGDIKWTWVKAHDGNHYNEQADCLAKAAAESMRETV